MPRPTRTKPPIPAWIIRERKRLGLKPPELAARLSAMGLPVAVGTVRTWEAGRNPHPDNIEGLEKIFGTAAPSSTVPTDVSGLVEAISLLVEELRASRLEQARWNHGVERVLDRLGKRLESSPPTERPAPQLPANAER